MAKPSSNPSAPTGAESTSPHPTLVQRKPRVSPLQSSLFRIFIGLVLIYGLVQWAGPDVFQWPGEFSLNYGAASVALLFVLISSVATTWRWRYVAQCSNGYTYPFWPCLRSFLLARVLGFFVSAVAMDVIGRKLGLKAQGHTESTANVIGQVVIERWLDIVIPLALVASWLIDHERALQDWRWLAAALATGLGLGTLTLRPVVAVVGMVHRWFARRKTGVTIEPPKRHLSTRQTLLIVGPSALRWFSIVAHNFAFALAVGVSIDVGALTLGTAASQLAAVAAFTPGGLGIQDLAWTLGLQVGLDPTEATRIAFVQRAGLMAAFGTLAALAWMMPWKSKVQPKSDVSC